MQLVRLITRSLVSLALVCSCCCFSVLLQAAEKSAAYHAAMESITSKELAAYVEHLADDEMQGREAGTRGGRAAAGYLTMRFSAVPLVAAGNDGGYQQPLPPHFRNILGMIPGNDPELKNEVIVVGAHYDHVGFGNSRNSFGPYGRIHHGADDNASGTAALLEFAEAFNFLPEPPKRSILVAAWDAEEKGLLGSKYWVSHPTVPLKKIVATFNLDMIGRLRNDHLYIYGSRSGFGWGGLFSRPKNNLGVGVLFFLGMQAH